MAEFDKDEFGFVVNMKSGEVSVFVPETHDLTPENVINLHLGAIKFCETTGEFFKMITLEDEEGAGNGNQCKH
jgi:hypothetical protein